MLQLCIIVTFSKESILWRALHVCADKLQAAKHWTHFRDPIVLPLLPPLGTEFALDV